MVERRREPRIRTQSNIRVRVLHQGQEAEGVLIDLNNAGAFVGTSLELPRGTHVQVELHVPGIEHPHPLSGIVARSSPEIRGLTRVIPAGLGVAFMAETAAERKIIQQMVTTTLALDLLGYGISRPTDTIAARPDAPASAESAEEEDDAALPNSPPQSS